MDIHPALLGALKSPSPLFCTPACQRQGFPIIFLFIEDRSDVEICLVAKMDIVGTRCALQPLRQLLLRTFLTEIVKDGPFLFITMLILKDRSSMFASEADMIP